MHSYTYQNTVPPKVTIEGPNQTDAGSNVTIQCNLLEGYPIPSIYIITPQGKIDQYTIKFTATIEDAGNYTCIANNSLASVTSNLSLIIHGMTYMYIYIMLINT